MNDDRLEHGYAVWAPAPQVVELEVNGVRHAMRARPDGWWDAPDVARVADADYGFALDGGPLRPDPRSAWQPHGVDGPSRVVDHGAFRWSHASFSPADLGAAVIYELHVGTFTPGGCFRDVSDHLDHLRDLGVTHIELMPVAAFSGRHGWGYDGVSLWAPHPGYGAPDDLRGLVDAAHGAGIAVLLDVVYNHVGPEGNHLSCFGPYFTDHHHTPWGDAVNLDGAGSPEVRRFIIENALMWLRDYRVDGLRLDAVHALRDDSALHLLEELAAAVDDLERDLGQHKVLIAESDRNDPRTIAPRPVGYGLDAQWADDLHHGLHVALTGERTSYYADFTGLADVAAALERGLVYDGRLSPARSRRHGRPMSDFDLGSRPADRLVTSLENHDQIGNRALGERTNHLVAPDRYLVGATLALTAPGVPMLFQGEEWAATAPFLFFADHQDPGLVDVVRAGRIEEFAAFGWDPDVVPDPEDESTFERSVLDWTETTRAHHQRALHHYRTLLDLRRTRPELHDGRFVDQVDLHPSGTALGFRRGDLLIAANLGAERVSLSVGGDPDLLVGCGEVRARTGRIDLGPDSALVAEVGPTATSFSA
ncbi:MAG: malto-oligosyltrehalose trehalohydrolase [Acidimicrobiales bacterium]